MSHPPMRRCAMAAEKARRECWGVGRVGRGEDAERAAVRARRGRSEDCMVQHSPEGSIRCLGSRDDIVPSALAWSACRRINRPGRAFPPTVDRPECRAAYLKHVRPLTRVCRLGHSLRTWGFAVIGGQRNEDDEES